MLSKEKGNKSGILIALSLILFLVAIIMAIISTSKTVAPKEDKITYTEKSNIDYKVLVKQNGYNKKYLEAFSFFILCDFVIPNIMPIINIIIVDIIAIVINLLLVFVFSLVTFFSFVI